VLLQRYVEERSHAQIAARLKVSEGAVAMRLQRSKQALLDVLATRLRPEAAAFGWVDLAAESWQETRIWCPFCGAGYVRALRGDDGRMSFHCACSQQIVSIDLGVLGPLKSLKSIMGRALTLCNDYYRAGLLAGATACMNCGRELPVRLRLSAASGYGVEIHCPACELTDLTNLHHLALDLPETRQFWRDHPRMHMLPLRPCTFAERPALLTSYASRDHAARLDVVSAADTLEVLAVELSRGPLDLDRSKT
jgi:hypothetical protein